MSSAAHERGSARKENEPVSRDRQPLFTGRLQARDRTGMSRSQVNEVLPTILVILAGTILAVLQASRYPRKEASLLLTAFAMHIGAVFFHAWITRTLYGTGDMYMYLDTGRYLSRFLEVDFSRSFDEITKLFFYERSIFDDVVEGPGNATGSMSALATVFMYVLNGSEYAALAAVSILAYFGTVALYRTFREVLPKEDHKVALFSCLLFPSVVFWSSGFLKEAFVMVGLGWMVLGTHRLMQGRFFVGLIELVPGLIITVIVKPYIGIAFVAAGSVWFYWRRTSRRTDILSAVLSRPAYLILGVGLVLGMLVVVGKLSPVFAVENIGESTARYQSVAFSAEGGTNYAIGDPNQRSLAGQLAFAPLALLTSLFRPFFFEVRSAQVALASLESTAAIVAMYYIFRRNRPMAIVKRILASPTLVFCAAFALTLAVFVGLTSTNLGSLVRYRMPFVPFYAILLGVLARAVRSERLASAKTQTNRALQMPRPRSRRRRNLEPVGSGGMGPVEE